MLTKIKLLVEWFFDQFILPWLPEKGKKDEDKKQ